jgi:hypothetical protein
MNRAEQAIGRGVSEASRVVWTGAEAIIPRLSATGTVFLRRPHGNFRRARYMLAAMLAELLRPDDEEKI